VDDDDDDDDDDNDVHLPLILWLDAAMVPFAIAYDPENEPTTCLQAILQLLNGTCSDSSLGSGSSLQPIIQVKFYSTD